MEASTAFGLGRNESKLSKLMADHCLVVVPAIYIYNVGELETILDWVGVVERNEDKFGLLSSWTSVTATSVVESGFDSKTSIFT